MKVLIWGMTENLGGLETFMENYMMAASKLGIQFDFIATCPKLAIEDSILKCGGKIYYICSRKQDFKTYRSELRNLMKCHSKDYDVVWLNDCLFCNIDILKLAKKYGIKKRIVHAHNSENMGSKIMLLRHKLNLPLLKRYATDFWACSKKAAEWSYPKSILNSKKIRVIANAIKLEKFSFNLNVRNAIRKKMNIQDSIVVGFVGRLDYQKNPEFAIDIFKEFNVKNPNSILIIVGDGRDRKNIQEKIVELGISNNVKLLGIRKDVSELMQAMDIILMPSRFEGLGIVAVEAQASGIITVISDSFPNETRMTESILSLELERNADEWAQKISDMFCVFERKNNLEKIKAAGYEIESAAIKLVEFLQA